MKIDFSEDELDTIYSFCYETGKALCDEMQGKADGEIMEDTLSLAEVCGSICLKLQNHLKTN